MPVPPRGRRYAAAADACLRFFLDHLVSPQTGMFGWGEHLFYNVFLDYLIGGAFTVRLPALMSARKCRSLPVS